MSKSNKSGGFATTKNVGPQMAARNFLIGEGLEGRPVVGVQQDFVLEPVGDVLLADGPVHDFGEPFSKSCLATASNVDSAAKRSNVRFLHGHPLYTNRFVRVNEPVCVTAHKEVCTVLPMPATQRKPAPTPARSNRRQAIPGPDGKTLGQRVNEAMAHEAGRRGAAYEQKDLIADVNQLVRVEGEEALLSQAMASAIMRGKVTRSTFTPFIAKACHVDVVWLARGVGQMIPKA